MKKNSNKKVLKKLILILILIILLISVILIILKINSNTSSESGYTATNIGTDKIIPMSSEAFFQNYYGNIESDEVYITLTKMANYIIDNKQDIDNWTEDEMYNIYNENKEEFLDMGLIDEDSFIDVMEVVQTIDSDDLSLSYMAFENDTIENIGDGVQVDITFKYVNIDEISFKLELLNDSNEENAIKIFCE